MEVPQRRIDALQSMNAAALAVGPAIARLSSALVYFSDQVYALAWEAYIRAGAPYGENREGFDRWLKEQRLLST